MRKKTARFLRASGVAVALAIAAVLLVLNCGECSGKRTGVEAIAGSVLASQLDLGSDADASARSHIASADAASGSPGVHAADAGNGVAAPSDDAFGHRSPPPAARFAPDSKSAFSRTSSGGVVPLLLDSSPSRRGGISGLGAPVAPSTVTVDITSGGPVPVWIDLEDGGGGAPPSGSLPPPGPSVPEPGAGLLFGAGLLTVAARLARRRRS